MDRMHTTIRTTSVATPQPTSDAAATGSAVTQPNVSEATTRSEGPLLGRRRSAPSVGPRAPGPLTPQAAASALGGSQASTTGAGHELDVLGSTAAATTPTRGR